MNYKMVAYQIGDLLKYTTSRGEIERAARSVFSFSRESFPSEGISSVRAQLFLEWVLTLAKQSMSNNDRNQQLIQFIAMLVPEDYEEQVNRILKAADIVSGSQTVTSEDFMSRGLNEHIHRHCRKLFTQENYFHAVFEAAKVYNKLVQEKSGSTKDGQQLMMDALSLTGVLKLNANRTDTDKNVQEGVMFLSAGLMRALRNPTAHEPALDWPISKEDCLDMLSFISYLLRQLDKSVYVEKETRQR